MGAERRPPIPRSQPRPVARSGGSCRVGRPRARVPGSDPGCTRPDLGFYWHVGGKHASSGGLRAGQAEPNRTGASRRGDHARPAGRGRGRRVTRLGRRSGCPDGSERERRRRADHRLVHPARRQRQHHHRLQGDVFGQRGVGVAIRAELPDHRGRPDQRRVVHVHGRRDQRRRHEWRVARLRRR